jgi:hypothetical protein
MFKVTYVNISIVLAWRQQWLNWKSKWFQVTGQTFEDETISNSFKALNIEYEEAIIASQWMVVHYKNHVQLNDRCLKL